MGDGYKIKFCHDVWCGDQPLKAAFPDLYIIACLRVAFVADHLQFSNDSLQLNVNFVSVAHDWELKFFFSFFD